MLTKRIIPCLDIQDGQTVKGVNFVNIRQAGNPVELGMAYALQGADELVYLDISATIENRTTFKKLVREIAGKINIPFTVGGGIQNEADVETLLQAGADKIAINSAAVKNPAIIDKIARRFGRQCIVLAIDTKAEKDSDYVYIHGGRLKTEKHTIDWAKEAVERGAGEILLTSMKHDGTRNGYAVEITRKISQTVTVPVIASGGAGKKSDFLEIFNNGKADAALAASIFHFNEIPIRILKKYLQEKNIQVRL